MISLLWALTSAAGLVAAESDSTIEVDAGHVRNRVSRLIYGSCIEDVNHEIYGGLYAQMIFGESFEEPPRRPAAAGWTTFGGRWGTRDGVFSVAADFGAKAVRDAPVLADGTVSCDVRLRDGRGGNAGLIVRVQDARVGADSWLGYEASISAHGKHLMLGRHRNNFRLLKQVPADIVPGRWYRLQVELAGKLVRVRLDADKPAIVYEDQDHPVDSGSVGVRTWGSDADFRNLVIQRTEGEVVDHFAPVPEKEEEPGRDVSGMWDLVRTGSAVARLGWDADRPFNSSRSQRIELTGGSGTVGVANRGLNRWGLAFRAGEEYAGHLYLRQAGYRGSVTVALQSADGRRTYASQAIGTLGQDWARHDFRLVPGATDTNARFALWIDGPGTVWVDQVYLSGTGAALFHGLPMRSDLGRALEREGLTVLRYGGSMVNAQGYRWKSMIGDRDRRPQYRGTWYADSTNGFGIEEFVQFCRAAGFECVFAINIEETPADAADLVEYLNGPATTPWGRRRAENGHPEPYHVKYIEIGNEETTNAHYLERFRMLYEAMHRRDPSLQLIIGAWWEPDNPVSRTIVEELSGKAALWDVHVGGDDPRDGAKVDALFARMQRLVQEWAPGTPLKACVLEENGGLHNLRRALGHAGILNATERHGDFVVMDCPANCLQPWRQNDNGWDQGQLFFTSSQVWGMPPYYAQQMAAAAHLPCRLEAVVKSPAEDLDVTATRDEAGTQVALKVVNSGAAPHRAEIRISGASSLAHLAEVTTLSGELDEINTPDRPERVRPDQKRFESASDRFNYEFPARSFTVLRLRAAKQ